MQVVPEARRRDGRDGVPPGIRGNALVPSGPPSILSLTNADTDADAPTAWGKVEWWPPPVTLPSLLFTLFHFLSTFTHSPSRVRVTTAYNIVNLLRAINFLLISQLKLTNH